MTCLLFPSAPCAWGCKGHQIIALIAEKHLTPETRTFVEQLLRENPVAATESILPWNESRPFAAASTWADDIRRQRPSTAPWHYINIPRGASATDLNKYCGDRGCVTQALGQQLAILGDIIRGFKKRAEALRFVIHFVGDLHMPLHVSDNNDLGGNCVPLKFFRRPPAQHSNSFSPNLHDIWDVVSLNAIWKAPPRAKFAAHVEQRFSAKLEMWRKAGIHVDDWTWESHDAADLLPMVSWFQIPIDLPSPRTICTDANHIGDRMLALHISAEEAYQSKALHWSKSVWSRPASV